MEVVSLDPHEGSELSTDLRGRSRAGARLASRLAPQRLDPHRTAEAAARLEL